MEYPHAFPKKRADEKGQDNPTGATKINGRGKVRPRGNECGKTQDDKNARALPQEFYIGAGHEGKPSLDRHHSFYVPIRCRDRPIAFSGDPVSNGA
jgi:hypothetical protein